jgi:hypothetical protein
MRMKHHMVLQESCAIGLFIGDLSVDRVRSYSMSFRMSAGTWSSRSENLPSAAVS